MIKPPWAVNEPDPIQEIKQRRERDRQMRAAFKRRRNAGLRKRHLIKLNRLRQRARDKNRTDR